MGIGAPSLWHGHWEAVGVQAHLLQPHLVCDSRAGRNSQAQPCCWAGN